MNDNKYDIALWTPLIGFDKEQDDKGAGEYLSKVVKNTTIISLFVSNADFINMHIDGLPQEVEYPQDYCNYYGGPQNEIRQIQKWTNYDFKALVGELEAKNVETYVGVMGIHLSPPDGDDTPQIGMFGYECKQDFIMKNRELAVESTRERGYVNLLKRFNDGTFYEDYFIKKTCRVLQDYGMTGVHLADCIFPPCIQIQHGDFSDDMIDQFVSYTHIKLPAKITIPLKSENSMGIEARADYIWNAYREEWINFNIKRWKIFFTKMCDALHSIGKKIMVNNAWTSEPFESVYRYGIDYKALEEAGVDIIAIEDQATILLASEPEGSKYRFHEYMNMPTIMRAYTPKIKYLCINYAKDSSEEGSIINHMPCADEKEIYSLTSPLYIDDKGSSRVSDGFFVCLADTISENEWNWLNKRYNIAFSELAKKTWSTTLVWSDNMMTNFLPEYISTKRWSTHRIVSEFSRYGGKIGAVVRIENLEFASGNILIPNIDLLSHQEQLKIKEYKSGGVIFTSIASKNFSLPDKPKLDIYFEDNFIARDDYRMCIGAYNIDYLNYRDITQTLGDIDNSEDLCGEPRYIRDSEIWLDDILFRKASKGFIQAGARLLSSTCQDIATIDRIDLVTMYEMQDGRIRFIAENEMLNHYKTIKIRINNRKIRKIINANEFPVQPLKLLVAGDKIRSRTTTDDSELALAKGFIMKLPPNGISIVDVILE